MTEPADIANAVAAVLEAQEWPAVVEVLGPLPAPQVTLVAQGLWDRAWHLLEEGEPDAARQVGLLGELVERLGLVGPDATVEAFLEIGTVEVGLEQVERAEYDRADPRWPLARYDIGILHARRYALRGDLDDLDVAVQALTDATEAPEPGDRADAFASLASVLWQRFTANSEPADLERGVAAAKQAESGAEPALAHNTRGNLLKERYDWFGDPADLDAAIAAYEQALTLVEPDDPDHAGFSGNLAMAHADRYLRVGAEADLSAAHVPPGAPVGPLLELRAEELNRPADEAAIRAQLDALEQAVAEQPPYAPERFIDLGQLGSVLHIRWGHTGDPADLARARRCQRRALTVTPPRSVSFPVRAYAVADSALSAGAVEEAIRWATAALDAIPAQCPLRPAAASLLGTAYNARYDRSGEVDDLSTGIQHLGAAVATCPRGSRELPSLANNLGNALRRRFHRTRDIADLDEAVEQLQHAVDATEPGSINRPGLLRNLAAALTDAQQAVTNEGGTSIDLADDAITAARAALDAFGQDHPDRPDVHEILAGAHLQRALVTGERTDFDAAVAAARAALADPDHGSALAGCLAERFDRFGDPADRAEAARQYRRLATDPRRSDEGALRDARNWGRWEAGHGAWPAAAEAFDEATRRAERLYRTQRLELGTAEWLDYTKGLPHWAAFAHYRNGAMKQAVAAFEKGRAVLLRRSLGVTPSEPIHLVPAHIVHLVATQLGGVALVTTPDGTVTGLDLPQLSGPALDDQVNAMIEAHDHRREQPARWNRTILDLTAWAWDAVVGPLLDELDPNPRIVLVPGGGGALVPWHAAWPAGAGSREPRPAIARATISYAPHRQALVTARELAQRAGPPKHLLSIVDPPHAGTSPLPDAAVEASVLAQRFRRHSRLNGAAANRAAVLECLRSEAVDTLLAACHADADLAEPTNSALLLAGEDTLTVEELQRLTPTFAPLRLALLTACRSAQPGAHLPDETINLPTALLRAGCAASIGTLWAVPSRTAAVFTALFAGHWLDEHLDPAAATRAALEDLYTIDGARERDLLGDAIPLSGAPPGFRSHTHPARWAAFVCSGW